MPGEQKGSSQEGILRGDVVDKIRLLLEEEGLIDSTPQLVAVPLPVAVSLEQAAAPARRGALYAGRVYTVPPTPILSYGPPEIDPAGCSARVCQVP